MQDNNIFNEVLKEKNTHIIKKAAGFLGKSKLYKNNNSLNTVIPKPIINKFKLTNKDLLLWDIEDDKIIIHVKDGNKTE